MTQTFSNKFTVDKVLSLTDCRSHMWYELLAWDQVIAESTYLKTTQAGVTPAMSFLWSCTDFHSPANLAFGDRDGLSFGSERAKHVPNPTLPNGKTWERRDRNVWQAVVGDRALTRQVLARKATPRMSGEKCCQRIGLERETTTATLSERLQGKVVWRSCKRVLRPRPLTTVCFVVTVLRSESAKRSVAWPTNPRWSRSADVGNGLL